MYIKVLVTPSAKKERVVKDSDTQYRINVKEPATRNLANQRVRELLCHELGLEKGEVRLVSGHHSPQKMFSVTLSTNE